MTLGERIAVALHAAGIEPVGRVFLPAAQPGEVPQDLLFVQRGPRLHSVAVVADLGVHRSTFTFGERTPRDGRPQAGFVGDHGDDDAVVARTVERVRAWLASPRSEQPNAVDVAAALLVFLRPVVREGTFLRLSTWGEWDERGWSGSTISLGGAEEWGPIAYVWHVEQGVSVRIPGDHADALPQTLAMQTFEAADASLPAVIRDATRAVAGWRRFMARPIPVAAVAHAIVTALTASAHASAGRWAAQTYDGDWPSRWPSATIWLWDHVGARQHAVLALEESAAGVTGPGIEVRRPEDLGAAVQQAVAYVGRWRLRLTPDKLDAGRRYRVLLGWPGTPAGALLRFVEARYVAHDGFTTYEFDAASLSEADADADAILRSLDVHLVAVD